MKNKRKTITWAEYKKIMDEIISSKSLSVADTFIKMLETAAYYKIKG